MQADTSRPALTLGQKSSHSLCPQQVRPLGSRSAVGQTELRILAIGNPGPTNQRVGSRKGAEDTPEHGGTESSSNPPREETATTTETQVLL